MTLVMGIVAALALLILTAVGFADLAMPFKTMRRDRAPAASAQAVRAIAPQTQARLIELVAQEIRYRRSRTSGRPAGSASRQRRTPSTRWPRVMTFHACSCRTWTPWRQRMNGARSVIAQGRTIQAISVIREETGLGLKEAKQAADGLRKVRERVGG